MKRIILAGAAVALAAATSLAATRVHSISGNVTAVTVSRAVDVDYYPTQAEKNVTVTGPENFVGLVTVKQHGSTLNISINAPGNKSVRIPDDLKVTLKLPPVAQLSASSSADIHVRGTLAVGSKNVTLAAGSSGEIEVDDLSATANVSVSASSSGDVKVRSLRASNLSVDANSSGEVDILSANATNISVNATSSADVTVKNCSATNIKVTANSSADVELKGLTAKYVILDASSSADISASGAATGIKASAIAGGEVDVKDLRGNLSEVSKSTGGSVKTGRR